MCPRPKLLVATLGALMMEYEDVQLAAEFMMQAARNVGIRWNAALDHFAPESLDAWPRVKQEVERTRQGRDYLCNDLLFPPSVHKDMTVGAFPWRVTQRLLALPGNFPTTYSSYLYGKRTLEQVHSIARILLSLPSVALSHPKWFPAQVADTLYDKELGVSKRFLQAPVSIAFCTPFRIVEVVQARMVEALLIIVPRDSAATMSATRSLLAQEVAFAAYLDPSTRTQRITGDTVETS